MYKCEREDEIMALLSENEYAQHQEAKTKYQTIQPNIDARDGVVQDNLADEIQEPVHGSKASCAGVISILLIFSKRKWTTGKTA